MLDLLKIVSVISSVRATAIWEGGGEETSSFHSFVQYFHAVFDHPRGAKGVEMLLRLTQGDHMAAKYALEFRTLVASSGWNQPALLTASELPDQADLSWGRTLSRLLHRPFHPGGYPTQEEKAAQYTLHCAQPYTTTTGSGANAGKLHAPVLCRA